MSEASKDKRVNYVVADLDLKPFKALRWQRRRLVALDAASQPAPASQLLVREACQGRSEGGARGRACDCGVLAW